MDAKGLLNAGIVHYVDSYLSPHMERTQSWRVRSGAASDVLVHLATVVLDVPERAATEWIGDTIEEIIASRC